MRKIHELVSRHNLSLYDTYFLTRGVRHQRGGTIVYIFPRVGYGIAASGKDKGMECLLWNLHSTLNQKTTENVDTSKFHLPFSMIWAFTSGAEFWCGFRVMLDDHTLESVYRLDDSLILGLRSGHKWTRLLDLP